MVKKKLTPAEAGKGQTTVGSYYLVVEKPAENKNEGKPLEIDEANIFLDDNDDNNDNDNDNNSYNTITPTIRTQEGTITGPNVAPTDEGKDVGLGKTKADKEELERSGEEEEDEDGSTDGNIVSDENQEINFNDGTEKVTNMETDTETTNVGVLLKGDKNMEGPDGKAGEKAESNIEQTKEGTNKSKMNNKTETEEATSMGTDTEAIGSGSQSGLLNHVVGFYTKGVVASKSMEEETNKIVTSKSMFENTNNMENSEVKGGTVDGDTKKKTVGVEKPMKDEWEFDDFEEDDTIDGKQENTEESADDEKVCNTEDNNSISC